MPPSAGDISSIQKTIVILRINTKDRRWQVLFESRKQFFGLFPSKLFLTARGHGGTVGFSIIKELIRERRDTKGADSFLLFLGPGVLNREVGRVDASFYVWFSLVGAGSRPIF